MTEEEPIEDEDLLWETAGLLNQLMTKQRKVIDDLSYAMTFSADEAAQAIQTLSRAGITGADAGRLLRGALKEMLCDHTMSYAKVDGEWIKTCEECQLTNDDVSDIEILALEHIERKNGAGSTD